VPGHASAPAQRQKTTAKAPQANTAANALVRIVIQLHEIVARSKLLPVVLCDVGYDIQSDRA
jgi:hypothetical protein